MPSRQVIMTMYVFPDRSVSSVDFEDQAGDIYRTNLRPGVAGAILSHESEVTIPTVSNLPLQGHILEIHQDF